MSQQQRDALDDLLRDAPLDLGGEVAEQRVIFEEMMAAIPLPADVTTSSGSLGGVPVVNVETAGADHASVIFYLHGGAYAIGTAASSVGLASDLARRAGARLVTIDYRLAPEHPHPAAIDDAVAAYPGLLDTGLAASAIAIAGESAGAGLVAATLVALKHAGLPQPTAAVLMSNCSHAAYATHFARCDTRPETHHHSLPLQGGDPGSTASRRCIAAVAATKSAEPRWLLRADSSHESAPRACSLRVRQVRRARTRARGHARLRDTLLVWSSGSCGRSLR